MWVEGVIMWVRVLGFVGERCGYRLVYARVLGGYDYVPLYMVTNKLQVNSLFIYINK